MPTHTIRCPLCYSRRHRSLLPRCHRARPQKPAALLCVVRGVAPANATMPGASTPRRPLLSCRASSADSRRQALRPRLRSHYPRLVIATPLSDPVAPGPFCATAGCSHDIPGVPPHGRHVSRHCLSPSTRCCQRPECPEWDAAAGMRVRVRMKKNEKSNTKDPRQRRRKGVPPAGFEPAAFRSLGDCYKTNAPYQPSSEGLTFSKKPAI